MDWLGLDIGGANIKLSDGDQLSRSIPFALWQKPEQLATQITQLLSEAPTHTGVAITMTGELCDCFGNKTEGVQYILDAVLEAVSSTPTLAFLTDGQLVPIPEAQKQSLKAAASNWLALAQFSTRFIETGTGLLLDIGSTTTDIIPLKTGKAYPAAFDDPSRLLSGELVYMGVGRTPLAMAVNSMTYRRDEYPTAAELFATTSDAYIILDNISEDETDFSTADGRARTKGFSTARLARSICVDPAQFNNEDAQTAAIGIRNTQLDRLKASIQKVCERLEEPPQTCVVSGSGEFLAQLAIQKTFPECNIASMTKLFGKTASDCAPAFALANLANEANQV